MNEAVDNRLAELEERIGHAFTDRTLLERALVHRSARAERNIDDNETFEFLGDAVLDLAVADLLMHQYPEFDEGHLSRARASLVSTRPLAGLAARFDIGIWLELGKGEEQSGGREKPRILESAYEAVIGAVFLDAGFDVARAVVADHMAELLTLEDRPIDHKTELQELTQKLMKMVPTYRVTQVRGPDHERIYDIEVELDGEVLARGSGPSRKLAEQLAAKQASVDLQKR